MIDKNLLTRDLLLYIATVASATGAVLIGNNIWQGLAALGFAAGVFFLRVFLKQNFYDKQNGKGKTSA